MGDFVCALYGCSVPVVLRKLPRPGRSDYWQLVGDAYVDGVMDGEALRLPQSDKVDVEFEIR